MRCDDIDDMTLKCHVRRQDTLQLIKVKAYPGPWPSIPVSLLPTKCSEQAAAGSRRQQQQTAGSSRKQQEAAEKIQQKKKIPYLKCIGK